MYDLATLQRDFPNYVYNLFPSKVGDDILNVYDLRNESFRKLLQKSDDSFRNSSLNPTIESKILRRNRPIVFDEKNHSLYSMQILEDEKSLNRLLDCHEDLRLEMDVPKISSCGVLDFLGNKNYYVNYAIDNNMVHLSFYLSSKLRDKNYNVSKDLGEVCSKILKRDYEAPDDLLDYVVDMKNNKVLLYNFNLSGINKDSENKLFKSICPFLEICSKGDSENFKKGLDF